MGTGGKSHLSSGARFCSQSVPLGADVAVAACAWLLVVGPPGAPRRGAGTAQGASHCVAPGSVGIQRKGRRRRAEGLQRMRGGGGGFDLLAAGTRGRPRAAAQLLCSPFLPRTRAAAMLGRRLPGEGGGLVCVPGVCW